MQYSKCVLELEISHTLTASRCDGRVRRELDYCAERHKARIGATLSHALAFSQVNASNEPPKRMRCRCQSTGMLFLNVSNWIIGQAASLNCIPRQTIESAVYASILGITKQFRCCPTQLFDLELQSAVQHPPSTPGPLAFPAPKEALNNDQ